MLASVPLLGLLPATAILDAAGDESLQAVAAGELRPAYVPARPPGDVEPRWTVRARGPAWPRRCPRARPSTAARSMLDGAVAFVPDAPGAGLLVAVGVDGDGDAGRRGVAADADGVDGRDGGPLRRHPLARRT